MHSAPSISNVAKGRGIRMDCATRTSCIEFAPSRSVTAAAKKGRGTQREKREKATARTRSERAKVLMKNEQPQQQQQW
mgnify:CR=1 FL=1